MHEEEEPIDELEMVTDEEEVIMTAADYEVLLEDRRMLVQANETIEQLGRQNIMELSISNLAICSHFRA